MNEPHLEEKLEAHLARLALFNTAGNQSIVHLFFFRV